MKRLIIILIISVVSANASFPQSQKGKVKNGCIDLSNYDFNSNSLANLSGEWEFYWQHFYTHDDFLNDTSLVHTAYYMNVPSYWNDFTLRDSTKLTGDGYATYRLRVKGEEGRLNYAIRMRLVSTAYVMYIDGKEVSSAGKIAKNKETSQGAYQPSIIFFDVDSPEFEIIVHLSNFDHREGGMCQEMRIGRPEIVTEKRSAALVTDMFLIGCILIMSLYHFGTFIVRRKDKPSLLLSLFCFFMALRIGVIGEYTINYIANIPWRMLVVIEYNSVFLCCLTMAFYIRSLFSDVFNSKVLIALSVVIGLFSLITILTPVRISSHLIPILYVVLLSVAAYLIYVLIKTTQRRRYDSILFLIGILVIVATMLNDILYQSSIITTTNMAGFGLLVFALIQAFLISKRFSLSLYETEQLTKELNDINQKLEVTIEKRNNEIEQQSEELMTQSENLQEMNQKMLEQTALIERSTKRITESLAYAKRIQKAIFHSEKILSSYDLDYFLIFKPKEIVSGDYHWIKALHDPDTDETNVIVAVADSGQYGVPGAFVSTLEIALLNEIILQNNFTTPSTIIDELEQRMFKTLNERDINSTYEAGVDIAIVNINITTQTIDYSGIHNDILFIEKEHINPDTTIPQASNVYVNEDFMYTQHVIEAQSPTISTNSVDHQHSQHTIKYKRGDKIYLFADGKCNHLNNDNYTDFDGKTFKRLLLETSRFNMQIQKEIIAETYNKLSDRDERFADDIIIFGIKL